MTAIGTTSTRPTYTFSFTRRVPAAMIRKHIQLAALTIAMHAAYAGVGQDYVNGLPTLEQGTADTSPLGNSLRVMHQSLATPLGFEQVYVLPGGKLMRASGGLYIVFDQSAYINTPVGAVPTFPNNPEFFIGPPPELVAHATAERERRRRSPYQVNMQELGTTLRAVPFDDGPQRAPRSQFVSYADDVPQPSVPVARPGGPAIVTDEAYRAARLKELMERAAAGR